MKFSKKKVQWEVEEVDRLFNVVEVFRATPSKKITTMGGIWYCITNLKPKIIEC